MESRVPYSRYFIGRTMALTGIEGEAFWRQNPRVYDVENFDVSERGLLGLWLVGVQGLGLKGSESRV